MLNIWTLSLEGNQATATQTSVLATAMADILRPTMGASRITPISLPIPANAPRIGMHTVVIRQPQIDRHNIQDIITRHGAKKPDIVIAARPETSGTAQELKCLTGAKIVQIENPNIPGACSYNLHDFDVIVCQPQERITGNNVIQGGFTLHGITPDLLAAWRNTHRFTCLRSGIFSSDPTVVAVMVGGSDEYITWDSGDFNRLGERLIELMTTQMKTDEQKTYTIVLTSRRTGELGTNILKRALGRFRNRLRVNEPASFEAVISRATHFIATGDSFMMLNQIMATGRPCAVDTLASKLNHHPLHPVLQECEHDGQIRWWNPKEKLRQETNRRPIPANDHRLARAVCQKLGLA